MVSEIFGNCRGRPGRRRLLLLSPEYIHIKNFVALVSAAPEVDVRLGLGRDFSDGAAVVLREITGKEMNGRSQTLTIPDEAFDGRALDSIADMCFDTGEIFDWATFESQ